MVREALESSFAVHQTATIPSQLPYHLFVSVYIIHHSRILSSIFWKIFSCGVNCFVHLPPPTTLYPQSVESQVKSKKKGGHFCPPRFLMWLIKPRADGQVIFLILNRLDLREADMDISHRLLTTKTHPLHQQHISYIG